MMGHAALRLPLYRRRRSGGFDPRSLFSSGEQGAWYDPSDLTTMFQNSTGTTPVTAVEQPVGLLLDKSKGLALGAELVTNGDFSSGTGWVTGTGATISGGKLNLSAASGYVLFRSLVAGVQVGGYYEVTFTVSGYVSGSIYPYLGSTPTFGTAVSANGTYTQRFGPTSGGEVGFNSAPAFTGSIDNLSVKAITGNHASQSTEASRPVLSARVNQLTYSEQFDNAVWTKAAILAFGSGSIANATTAPDGTMTADLLVPDTTNAAHLVRSATLTVGAAFTQSVYVRAAGYTKVALRESVGGLDFASFELTGAGTRLDALGLGSAATITPIADGWYRLSLNCSATSGRWTCYVLDPGYTTGTPAATWVPNGTSGIYLWGADLRVTNVGVNLPAYQRVAAATDYDTSGFPLYLRFDGNDDSLATGTIDFTATDKMSVFAGHRIVSGTGSQVMCELGTNAFSSSGFTFGQGVAAASSGLGFLMNAGSGIAAQTADKSVPYTSVSSLLLNSAQSGISNEGILRSNTTPQTYAATIGTDSGTANFPNKNLYIGNRSGSAVWFNGNLYSLIVRGAQSTDAQIASTETYVNSKTGAY